jgi:N-acyl-D-aspartate/D-glutamate deacylase
VHDTVCIGFRSPTFLLASASSGPPSVSKARQTERGFKGTTVRGVPVAALVRGTLVYQNGEILVQPGHGRFVRPGAA